MIFMIFFKALRHPFTGSALIAGWVESPAGIRLRQDSLVQLASLHHSQLSGTGYKSDVSPACSQIPVQHSSVSAEEFIGRIHGLILDFRKQLPMTNYHYSRCSTLP